MIYDQWLKPFIGDARSRTLQFATFLAKRFGRHCLDRTETLTCLEKLGCEADAYGVLSLNSSKSRAEIEILSSGVVRLNHRDCLDLDYGSRGALRGWSGAETHADNTVAIWSHRWMGYYHWLIDVAPKIVAVQATKRGIQDDIRWVFPSSGQAYESEILSMLGISGTQVIDTKRFTTVHAESVAMVALPGWFEIQPAAALLRERLLPAGRDGVGARIYLKRRGRRICVNEEEVIRLLKPMGFVMVEDDPRSVAAQIGIFKNAKVVVAPHGAALANLLWCSPESLVIECFADGYSPPYYENLAAFIGMRYNCVGKTPQTHWTGVGKNIRIDIYELSKCLEQHGIR